MKKKLIGVLFIILLLIASLATISNAATISNITVNSVTAPIPSGNWMNEGKYVPTISPSANYQYDTECGNYGYEWKDMTTNTFLNAGDTFISGHEYTLYVYLKTKAGSEFYLINNNYNLNISTGSIKGLKSVELFLPAERDRRYYVGIKYNFSKCGHVYKIYATVTKPAAGNTPDFTRHWSTDYGLIKSYTDLDYGEYIKKGVAWYDLTDAEYLTENDKFVCNHTYRLIWYIASDANYELATSNAITSAANVTFNNYTATVEKIQGMQLHAAIQVSVK